MLNRFVPAELAEVLRSCRSYFATAAAFSLAINLLYLASPLYMLQIYDRVIASASVGTLVMLTLVLLVALLALAGLDAVRARLLARASVRLDRKLASSLVAAAIEQSSAAPGAKSQHLRDFDNFRQTITGAGIHALYDLPWAPIYLLVIFMLHPALGALATVCAITLVLMAVANEWAVKRPLADAQAASFRNYNFTEMSLRNSESIRAMGMTAGLLRRWSGDRNAMIVNQILASDRAALIQSTIKFLRLAMQSLILGLGAYLVIERSVTVGAIFAASILLGRALQPVEQLVGSWRSLNSAWSAAHRVATALGSFKPGTGKLNLPKPSGAIETEGVGFVSGDNRPILRNISFNTAAGDLIGLIGPSGAGKTTLAKHLVGVLRPSSGVVRLDGADVAEWPRQLLGQYIGYLPQDVELFADTVAANISRFAEGRDEAVLEAAKLAGAHDMILRLPQGYDTQIGEGGALLSGGMRQRVALARAVFGAPSLVVLDEPNSNLDAEGDGALTECLMQLRQRGTTTVVISHRPGLLNIVDKVLFVRDGTLEMFGPREEVLARLTRKPPQIVRARA